MASLQTLCENIAANLQDVTNVQWSAYMLLSPTPPYGEVRPGAGGEDGVITQYDAAMRRGADWWNITVRVHMPVTSDIAAQQNLYAFLDSSGDLSVKELIESDPTLGGECDDLQVTACRGLWTDKDGTMVIAEWVVKILASG